jgi:hypothetical protein
VQRQQPSHPIAVRLAHQVHWEDRDTSTGEGASCARHTRTDQSGSAAVHDAADGAVVAHRQTWASCTEVMEGLVGAGAGGSWESPERSGQERPVADGAGAEPGVGWTEE